MVHFLKDYLKSTSMIKAVRTGVTLASDFCYLHNILLPLVMFKYYRFRVLFSMLKPRGHVVNTRKIISCQLSFLKQELDHPTIEPNFY